MKLTREEAIRIYKAKKLAFDNATKGKSAAMVNKFQREVKAVLKTLATPMRGCDLARLVCPSLRGSDFVKNDGEFRAGVLPILLDIHGLVMLKPLSTGDKVIISYSQVDKDDKTPVFFILDENWDNKLPEVK